jgi:hypothetical protein
MSSSSSAAAAASSTTASVVGNVQRASHLQASSELATINVTVSVPFATIHYDDTGVNVTYSILCHDSNNSIKWMVKRRYNDFKVLHQHVGRHVPESADIFPSSGGFFRARTNSSRSSIETRRAAMHKYMAAMVSSLLGRTTAKQQRLCQPLIVKLLQFLEYPEWEEDDAGAGALGGGALGGQQGDAGTIVQFWRQEADDAKSEASASSAAAAFFAVSSFVEEAFNAQAPDIDIASHRSNSGLGGSSAGSVLSGGSLGAGGNGGAGSSAASAASSSSRASSNAEDAGAMSLTALSTVTTYWAAPDAVKNSKIAIEIPDVACAPTVDGEFAVTVKSNIRASRGDVRRKYDEMLYVIARVFAADAVPTPTLMREIILQFRRQNPKRQYARGAGPTLRREAVDELNAGGGGEHHIDASMMGNDGLIMADTMMDGSDAGGSTRGSGSAGGNSPGQQQGGVPIPIGMMRGLIDESQAGAPAFASPPARGALADGRVSQLPSTFGSAGPGGAAGALRICRTVPRVSNSSHFVVNDNGQTVPFRECKCSELAYCSSGKTEHMQTPCGFTILVEPTPTPNFGQ